MTIHIEKGLSSDQGDELLELASRIANDNLSSPSIFTICEGIKEWLGEYDCSCIYMYVYCIWADSQ